MGHQLTGRNTANHNFVVATAFIAACRSLTSIGTVKAICVATARQSCLSRQPSTISPSPMLEGDVQTSMQLSCLPYGSLINRPVEYNPTVRFEKSGDDGIGNLNSIASVMVGNQLGNQRGSMPAKKNVLTLGNGIYSPDAEPSPFGFGTKNRRAHENICEEC